MMHARLAEFGPLFQAMADYERDYRREVVYPVAARQAPHLRERALQGAATRTTDRRSLRRRLSGRLALVTRVPATRVP